MPASEANRPKSPGDPEHRPAQRARPPARRRGAGRALLRRECRRGVSTGLHPRSGSRKEYEAPARPELLPRLISGPLRCCPVLSCPPPELLFPCFYWYVEREEAKSTGSETFLEAVGRNGETLQQSGKISCGNWLVQGTNRLFEDKENRRERYLPADNLQL